MFTRSKRSRLNVTFVIVSFGLFSACLPKTVVSKPKSNQSSNEAAGAPAFSPDDVVFGPELEFTDPKTSDVNYGIHPRYLELVKKMCANDPSVECIFDTKSFEIKSKNGKGRVKGFPHIDPAILEIPLDPMTVRQAEESRDLIQKYVFDATQEIGLTPGTKEYNRWSAHMNFSWPGLRSGDHGDLLLRYVADFNKHPALGMGAFSGDIRNAPVLAMENEEVQKRLASIVEEFNAGNGKSSAFEVADRIRGEVYSAGNGFEFGGGRYNAFNLTHVNASAEVKKAYDVISPVRVEQRASYMPLSADHLISNYKVITGRLNYLSKQTGKIAYAPVLLAGNVGRKFQSTGVQEGFDAKRVAQTYVSYLDEAGLDKDYHIKHMMNPVVQSEAAQIAGIDMGKILEFQKKAAALLKSDVLEYIGKAGAIGK